LKIRNSEHASGPSVSARHYQLACTYCGRRQEDDGLILECSADHEPALLQSSYTSRKFTPRSDSDGLYRYRDWLPVTNMKTDLGRAVVYRSHRLAGVLGLPNLWIAFSGYWPERNATLNTATFKDFVANTALGRASSHEMVLTIASSGNTGAAFAWACSEQRLPCLIVVPAKGLHRMKFRTPLDPCVSLVAIDNGYYPDAIDLAAAVCRIAPFRAEGGIKNVARRDGLGTVLLAAFEEMSYLPSHYFQAVGSGTGAIAVLEAAKRLQGAGCDMPLPKLMLCQNDPFAPIYDAWRTEQGSINNTQTAQLRDAAMAIHADELANSAPPYEVHGGVHDALVQTGGDVLVADNVAVRGAMRMFSSLEGIDIEPSAGVALACLCSAVEQERIGKDSVVLLNISGGGRLRLSADYRLVPAEPRLRLGRESLSQPDTAQRVAALYASTDRNALG
jgi:cysteate synthase